MKNVTKSKMVVHNDDNIYTKCKKKKIENIENFFYF